MAKARTHDTATNPEPHTMSTMEAFFTATLTTQVETITTAITAAETHIALPIGELLVFSPLQVNKSYKLNPDG